MKRILAMLVTTALMVALTAVPALAQPVFTGGLVNVTITDVANNNTVTVQLPIAVAANVCDVNVNVLAKQFKNGGASCTAEVDSSAIA